MRFWQKTYLFTLALFLLCLNAGILSLAVYTYRKNVGATEASAAAEQRYIAKTFENDWNDLSGDGKSASPSLLMQSYGTHYGEKGMFFAFEQDGTELYSNFPVQYGIEPNTMTHTELEGKRYLLISSDICGGTYTFIFAKNVEELDTEFRTLMVMYSLTGLGVSLFLAVCLFFVLKRLSVPLDKLRATTERIECGDFSVTAEESGNDEFTLLAKSFNGMLAKINEQMAALEADAEKKQMLVDNMAHELRTPLTSIHGYAEVLEKATVTEETKIMAAKYILSEAKRLKKISELLLNSACIRGNAPVMREVELSAVLSDVAEKLSGKAAARGVTLLCPAEKTVVTGEETLLSMLFYNLTENAVKACSDGGTVRLCCSGGTASVSDDGKGMTEEQLSHITEPFYRTDPSRSRNEGGAGLGLSLCAGIAEAHGWTLRFASAVGKGTTVTVVMEK